MKLGQKLFSNSFYLFIDWFSITILSLLYWIVVGHTLSPQSYGIVATSINTVIILSSFGLLGLLTAVPKLVSEYLRKNDSKKARSLIAFSLRTIIIVNALIGAVLFLLSDKISLIFNIPQLGIQLAALMIVPAAVWSLSLGILQGYQNMRRIFTSDTVGYALKVVLAGALIIVGFSFAGPLIAWFFSLIVIILMRSSFLSLFSRAKINKKFVMLTYAFPAFVASIIWVFFANTPTIIISSIQGPAIAGLFALSLTITSPLGVVPNTLSNAMFPIVSSLSAEKNPKQRQRRLINLTMRYTFLVTIPLMAFFTIFSKEFILLFAQVAYLGARPLIPYLAIASFMFGIGNILSSSVYAIRKPKIVQYIALATTATFLLLVFPLTITLSAYGAALAYLAAGVVFLTSGYIFLKRFLKIKFPAIPLLKTIAAGILLAIISFLSLGFPLIVRILFALISLIAYILILIPMRYYTYEDIRILQIFEDKSSLLRKLLHPVEKLISKHVSS